MGLTPFLDRFIEATNAVLDMILPYLALAGFFGYAIYYLFANLKAPKAAKAVRPGKTSPNQLVRALTLEALLIAEMAAAILFFWSFPAWIGKLTTPAITTGLRWAIFIGGVFLAAMIFGNKGQSRTYLIAGLLSFTLLIGWLIDQWVGILLLTLPILFVFFWTVHQVAQIALPASPAGSKDGWTKTQLLLSYCCGVQRPMYIGDDDKKKAPEKRIDGKPGSKLPGLIWMPSHAVVGISSGNQFKRVDGPGSIYTGKFEQPFQTVDLRSHLWSSEIDVMTRDGIGFRLVVHASFRIDPGSKNGQRYTPENVKAALGTTAIEKQENDTILYWDDRVAGVIEEATRNRISEIGLDYLLNPAGAVQNDQSIQNAQNNQSNLTIQRIQSTRNDQKNQSDQSAQSKIGEEIMKQARPILQLAGVQLESVRIDQLNFQPEVQGKLDEISSRQLATWSDHWEGERSNILADAQAESDRLQQEARAYAESLLLSSIAEGLEKTQKIHPRLPRYVIAMRFLSALQEYIHRQKDDDGRIEETENLLLQWQKKYSGSGNEGGGS